MLSNCCGAETHLNKDISCTQAHSCNACGNPCGLQRYPANRPAFHVDDKLKEAAKKAAKVFEEEEKTEIQRLEERVKVLEGKVEELSDKTLTLPRWKIKEMIG